MIHLARLTTVIDCGTMNGERRVLMGFQLSEYDCTPQDPELPIYKQFAKTPYGGLIITDDVDAQIEKAGKMYDVDIEIGEYQGKPTYTVKSYTPSNKQDTFEWGVDVKTFKFTDSTTLQDIKDLGFDNKHVKNSDEYNILKQKFLDDDTVPF